MRIVVKIILTIVALMIATPIFALTKENPLLKLVVLAGLVGGVRAIWKYNPVKELPNNEKDNHQLKKN